MRILARARELEASGRTIIHMEIGEPDFPSPPAVVEAGRAALDAGLTHYTAANGLPQLRQAIAGSYAPDAQVDPGAIVVTPGASGALQLAMAALLDPGDGLLLADPGYPCNRHIASLFDADVQSVPVGSDTAYQLTVDLVREHWRENTRAVMVASPSNPTGTLIAADELAAINDFVAARGGRLIVDEIYHGLVYEGRASSILEHTADAFVVNSFSKYYGMTGWRIGWLVAPEDSIEAVNRLAQNMFLAAPTLSQHAALAALDNATRPELERRRELFRARRDFLLPRLEQTGFRVMTPPGGAFYIYADCQGLGLPATELCARLLEEAGVALTPGADFGRWEAERYVRFSYANTLENLAEGMARIGAYLGR